MTWVSPSATTLPGPLAMAMLRDAHNASRSGLGFARSRGLWAWSLGRPAASAATLPPHVRLYRRLAPSSLRGGYVRACWSRSAADPVPSPGTLPQHCANFTISLLRCRLDPEHFRPGGAAAPVRVLPAWANPPVGASRRATGRPGDGA